MFNEEVAYFFDGLKKLSSSSLKQFYFSSLSESLDAYQHLFNYCIYVFSSHSSVEKD